MKIVLSSNCMTGGLVASMRVLFPEADVVPLPSTVDDLDLFRRSLVDANYWIASNASGFKDAALKDLPNEQLRVVYFPDLYFNAFHPDQVYAWMPDGSLVEGATGPYNSAIVLWAWQHGLSAEHASRLFRPEIMHALGYHDRWSQSVDRLRHDFTSFPHLDYRDFIEPLRRAGCFMHTVNHPKVSAIARLARVLAHQIDPNLDVESVPLEDVLVDTLFNASFAWAVYPSVANSLGFTSQYLWKRADHSVIGLEQFVTESFTRYDAQQPIDIDCHELKWPIYDQVLLPASEGVRQ